LKQLFEMPACLLTADFIRKKFKQELYNEITLQTDFS